MSHILRLIGQRKEVHLMSQGQSLQLVKDPDLITLVRGIRDAMADVKDPHYVLVGAEGFEPTTSLELSQGALTAELHAYILSLPQTDGTHRTNRGPRTLVQAKGIRFHKAIGS